jgi:hypothetical protein
MDRMPTPEEIRRMSPEQRERSLAEFVDLLHEQAGPSVEVPVPRAFAAPELACIVTWITGLHGVAVAPRLVGVRNETRRTQ